MFKVCHNNGLCMTEQPDPCMVADFYLRGFRDDDPNPKNKNKSQGI